MSKKLNSQLAALEQAASGYKSLLKQTLNSFKDLDLFRGIKNTYDPNAGTNDVPSNRSYRKIVTTVDEKLEYFKSISSNYIDLALNCEASNANNSKATININGKDIELTTLELMRLKSILLNPDFVNMIEAIPCKKDSEIWNECTLEEYAGRGIFESRLIESKNQTVIKEEYILHDPNVSKDSVSYKPQVGRRDIPTELGIITNQKFSGESTISRKAKMLHNRSILLQKVIVALKEANDTPITESTIKSSDIFNEIFN